MFLSNPHPHIQEIKRNIRINTAKGKGKVKNRNKPLQELSPVAHFQLLHHNPLADGCKKFKKNIKTKFKTRYLN